MKLRSFRLRIALFSAILAGSALVGFGVVAWRLIYVAKVSRLDAKLENQVKRTIRPREQDWWSSFYASLPRELETEAATPILMLVLDEQGETLYPLEFPPLEPATLNLRPFLLPRVLLPLSQSVPKGSLHEKEDKNDRPLDGTSVNGLADNQLYLSLNGVLPEPKLITQRTATGSWRVVAVSSARTQAAIAVSLDAIDQEMGLIRTIFVVAIPSTLLLVAGGAWVLSGRALHPVDRLTTAMRELTVAGLDQAVDLGATDIEFVELIQVFNQMLERLERSFRQASRFSADAAHELKTPLAILQGELEQAMHHAESGSEVQQNLGNLLDEVRRLSGIVRKLLLLSLADAGKMSLYSVEVNLSEMLAVIVEDMELLAPSLAVQANIDRHLWVRGDRDLLAQVLQNLISNAIKYNLPEGWIKIYTQRCQNTVRVTIANASNPIPEGDRDRIFDRFYRGDPARTRKVEGIGLGLSLSREIARAHNGDLTLDATPVGQTALTLTLPGEV